MLEDFEEFDSTAAFLDELDLEETNLIVEDDEDENEGSQAKRVSSASTPAKRFMGMTPGNGL